MGRVREERVRRKKIKVREKVEQPQNTVLFHEAAGAEPSSEMRGEKLHGVVARSTFGSQHVQNTPFSDHFWKLTCRKCARRCGAKHVSKSKWAPRNKFQSQNVQNTPHFWKLRCPKSALRCGAKHILKSTC